MFRCRDCKDTGWVCEAHPAKPYTGTRCCGCGAVEMPCPRCSSTCGRNTYHELALVSPQLFGADRISPAVQGFADRSAEAIPL